ncbi:TadE/TadG family type IV pilus assembly protein [Calycomorphotria hydatis]|uniref:TadE-like protein n=1 Tax=Calycomorphotria hydatis TaxID=2528027 RepID=A0A517T3N3_9PLAN|nr:TadE/TadG family type IV pilus assembly protein [Calycomorphotria hydatis]QDT62986.1 TadE-like protein [Calycomorphotria hydatis]
MHSTTRQRNRFRRLGTYTVEFAIVAPILFSFVFAGIEFARMNMIRNTIRTAAYEGAREGTLPGTTKGKVRKAVKEKLTGVNIGEGFKIEVLPDDLSDKSEEITVNVRINFKKNSYFKPVYLSKWLSASCTLTREGIQNLDY